MAEETGTEKKRHPVIVFLDFLVKFFLPPEHSTDWVIVPWQPLLYLSMWIGALTLILFGDFANLPSETADFTGVGGIDWAWTGLSILCPPIALGSLHLIKFRTGEKRYRGYWLRLAADIGQFTSLSMYIATRFADGDYRVYPTSILIAAMLFIAALIYRDVRALIRTEILARRLYREAQ